MDTQSRTKPEASVGVLPPTAVCRQARLSRDARFDGRFFVGVLTTGIYCRPVCPARAPREDNVRYYPSAAAAQSAGFRPCMRCKPEASRSLPEWTLANDTVMRGLRMIEAGYLNQHTGAALAHTLNVSERHLLRLFDQELGASPAALARMVRANLARSIIASLPAEPQRGMRMSDVAVHAGYGSVSHFNAEIRQIFQCTPGALRRSGAAIAKTVDFLLPVRAPYHFDWIFSFLQTRALPGVEEVTGASGTWCYRRQVSSPDEAEAWLTVSPDQDALRVQVPFVEEPVHSLLRRVRRVFDLSADGALLQQTLGNHVDLAPWVAQAPGLRVPGAWDGFETAVRAVLGQQVSVKRGTQLARKMVSQYGQGHFPSAGQLQHQDVAELGMPGKRGQAVAQLAQAVVNAQLRIDETQDFDEVAMKLAQIPGIGPWTVNYIRMRAMKDPNAFPDNDWVVLKQLSCTAAQARKHAQAWQPWRAYGLMYLWYASSQVNK